VVGKSRFTAIAVRDLPYPEGLGKSEYGELETAMKALLGRSYQDQAANERLFWTPPYQDIIRQHLKEIFDPHGDIAEVAARAAAVASMSAVFDQLLEDSDDASPRSRYLAGIPGYDELRTEHGYLVFGWIAFPPRIFRQGPERGINNGRHRLSYLRSVVEPVDPNFQVLVELDH
jgi:hypothetical protein